MNFAAALENGLLVYQHLPNLEEAHAFRVVAAVPGSTPQKGVCPAPCTLQLAVAHGGAGSTRGRHLQLQAPQAGRERLRHLSVPVTWPRALGRVEEVMPVTCVHPPQAGSGSALGRHPPTS